MHTITTAELSNLLKPFAGAKLRGEYSAAVDVRVPGAALIDADIREVTDTELTRFFYSGSEVFPLASITRIMIRTRDADWNTVGSIDFRHIGLVREAA